MKKHVLSVKNLTKSYQERSGVFRRVTKPPFVAVDHISFSLGSGEVLGLLGPNGAGKTTTIQMLLSVLTPTEGDITFFGKNLSTHRSEILSQVAFASTYVKLPWRLTIMENLNVYGRLYGLSASDRVVRIERFLKFFGVWDQRDKEVSNLSAGQTTRVMLAKAFLAYPKIALLDEPTASLDPDIAHEVREFVQQQQKEYGVSILYTSHNMDEVADICDRVLFLSAGKIVANDTPKNLAASVSTTRVNLVVGDGLKRTERFAREHGIESTTSERSIELLVDEHKIAQFLSELAHAGVQYSQITIDKPTLEDYFLKVSRKSGKEGV